MSFQPGESGNPNGRPKGRADRRTNFNQMIQPHQTPLFQKAVGMALEGSESMLKLLLERLLPAKPRDSAVSIAPFEGSLTHQGETVLAAIAKGDITPMLEPMVGALAGDTM